MSLNADLSSLYHKSVAGKSILVMEQAVVKENYPPVEVGDFAPEDPAARDVLKRHAEMTQEKDGTPVSAHLREGGKGAMKRFYLAYIRKFDQITADAAIVVAIAVLNDVIQKLAEFPNSVYPKDTESFYMEVIKPSVEKVIPELTKGSVSVSNTYAKYIARAIKNAAIEAKILRETGKVRKAKITPDVKPSWGATAEDLDDLLGVTK